MAFYVPASENRYGIAPISPFLSFRNTLLAPAEIGQLNFQLLLSVWTLLLLVPRFRFWLDMRLSVSSGWQASVYHGLNRVYTIFAEISLSVGSENSILFT